MSCVFYRPEVAVTTFQLTLGVEGKRLGRRQPSRVPTLVKGCERRFAIEDCETIRLCTPSYYREDGESLVWDLQEGVIASSPQVEERWDDPADLEEQQRINAELANRMPRGSGIHVTEVRRVILAIHAVSVHRELEPPVLKSALHDCVAGRPHLYPG